MQKYFAVCILQLIILAKCAASLQSDLDTKTLEELKQSLDMYDKMVAHSEGELRQLEWQMEQDTQHLDFNEANTAMKQQFADLENQLSKCQTQLKEVGETKHQHSPKYNDYIKNILQRTADELVAEYKTKIHDKEVEMLKFKSAAEDSKIADLKSNISSLNAIIEDKNEEISKLKQIESEKQSICEKEESKRNKDLTDQNTELRKFTQTSADLEKQLNNKKQRILSLESELGLCNTDNNDYKGRLWRKDSELRISSKKLQKLNGEICKNGTKLITLPGTNAFHVGCDNWMIIQHRGGGGGVSFNRSWKDYKDGFGDFQKEFFLGLEKLHLLTYSQPHELHVQLSNQYGDLHAHYNNFRIGSEQSNYALESLGVYSGTAGDSMSSHLRAEFMAGGGGGESNCAWRNSGGWWYIRPCKTSIQYSNLNGMFMDWYKNGRRITFSKVSMKIRPKP